MAAEFDVDLFVIGAGSGGVRAARIASGHGARAMIAEEFRIGGTCVIRGCVPKKLLVYASRFAAAFRRGRRLRLERRRDDFDWPKLIAAKEAEIARLAGPIAPMLKSAGRRNRQEPRVRREPARRAARRRRARSRRATFSSRPARGRLYCRASQGSSTPIASNEMFDLPVFPRRLLVVGGGYIAVEFACIFRRPRRRGRRGHRAPTIFCAGSTRTCARICARR